MAEPRKPSDDEARRERASPEPSKRSEPDALSRARARAAEALGKPASPPASAPGAKAMAASPAPAAPPRSSLATSQPAPPPPSSGLKKSERPLGDAPVSPMASPVAHASPLGAGTSALAPATQAPSISGQPPPKPKGTPGEIASAAATILSGTGSEDATETTRETLEESAVLARTSASARARVAGLRARGASLPELDGRLSAADLLAKRGEPEAALKILEEVLVLSNALVAAFGIDGPIDLPDPLDARIDQKLERVLEKASEAARARTDELLASARLAEKVEEVARARAEELLASKRLSAKIEEVAQKHAEEVARGAVEALLSAEPFKQAVDARARARAEEAFATVKAGASPEAIEAAAEKALARREKDASSKLERILDPEALEQKLVPLVSSLVKGTLANEQAVQNKLRTLVAEEVAKAGFAAGAGGGDDEHIRRLVVAEIVRREAMSQADATGEGLSDRATAIARSDAMQQVLAEQFKVIRASVKAEVIEELERIAAANKKRMLDQRKP